VDRLNVDQPYVQSAVGLGVGAGKDRMYVGNNDFAAPGGRTATVDFLLDAGTPPPPAPPSGFVAARIEVRATTPQDGPPIRSAVHPDGTVYAAFYRWTAWDGSVAKVDVVVVRDNDGAGGATMFTDLVDPGDGQAGRRVVQDRTLPWKNQSQPAFGQERFVGSNLSIVVDPRDSRRVYLAWADRVGVDDYTLHVRRSTDRGATWTADLRTVTNATNPALAINDAGVVGFLYQQVTGTGAAQRWVTHLLRTVNDFSTVDDRVLATVPATTPAPQFIPYIGDYVHLMAIDNDFYGIFSAANTPDHANFPNGVVYQRNADFTAHKLLALDGATQVPISIDPFFFWVTGQIGPCAVSWSTGRLDTFVIGGDAALYHKGWDGSWYPSAVDYESLGGGFSSPPAAVAWGPDRLDIFGRGLGRAIWHKAWDGSSWRPSPTGWDSLGGTFASPPEAVAWGPNRLDIFGLGLDRAIWHKAWDGSSWRPSPTGWDSLGGTFASPPEAVAWGPNRLDIFGLGLDRAIWHKAWDGSSWRPSPTGWDSLGGVFSSPPAAVAWGPNRLDIFGRGLDRAIWHKAWDGSSWRPSPTGWDSIGGTFASPPEAVAWGPNRLDIFGIGLDGALWHKAWDGSSWRPSPTGWDSLGGVIVGRPSVVSWGPNRLDIFVIGLDRALYHKAWDGSSWRPSVTGWDWLGGVVDF
jgi:hypothetical protein